MKPVKSYELHVECGIATRKKSPNSESFNFSEVAFSVWVPRHAALLADAPPPGPVRSLEMLRLKGKFFALWKLSRLWVQYFNCRKMRILRLRIRFVPKTSVWGFFEVSVSAGSFRKGSKLEHSRLSPVLPRSPNARKNAANPLFTKFGGQQGKVLVVLKIVLGTFFRVPA